MLAYSQFYGSNYIVSLKKEFFGLKVYKMILKIMRVVLLICSKIFSILLKLHFISYFTFYNYRILRPNNFFYKFVLSPIHNF